MLARTRIATPYVRALFGLASEQNCLEAIQADLQGLALVCAKSREFMLLLNTPVIANHYKADLMPRLFQNSVHELTLNFLVLLSKRGRLGVLQRVITLFDQQYLEHKGEVAVNLRVASAPSKEMLQAFTALVTQLTQQKPRFEQQIDANLLGGFVLKLGYRQLDRSVRTELSHLKKHLHDQL